MENFRQKLLNNPDLFPEARSGDKAKQSNFLDPISIASSSSDTSAEASAQQFKLHRTKKAASAVIISSDEESGDDGNDSDGHNARRTGSVEVPVPIQTKPSQYGIGTIPGEYSGPKGDAPKRIPTKIHPEKDQFFSGPSNPVDDNDEAVAVAHIKDDHTYISPADAEKALRDLMSGGMNDETEVNMANATVKGFKVDIKLLPHQIIGRAWMRDREDTTKKKMGGILADDMGLGKTIQTLTRIVEGRARKSDRADGWAATSLVVCPLALVGQWADEIRKMTEDVTVLKHHGSSRTSDPLVLRKYHVVVTTYDIVKSEYLAYSPLKDESKAKTSKKKKNLATRESSDSDGSAENFGRTVARSSKSAKKSALFQVHWWRIILDEAHNIKNRKTKGAIACCALEGKFRWCLTGTPMQNNVVELYSLFKFLRIKPFSNWDEFDSKIAKHVTNGRSAKTAMKRLQAVLQQIMLRRRKDQLLNGKPIIELPDRIVNVVSCPFDASEKAFYTSLENKMESLVQKLVGSSRANYMGVLLLLLRLRQACNHPALVLKDYKSDMDALDPQTKKSQDSNEEETDDLAAILGQLEVARKCQMCTTELGPENISPDDDYHCRDCASLVSNARGKESRPSSAKIRMIMKLLQEIEERSDGEEKTIIFSQFTSMLNLIEPFLKDAGVKYVRYDGSMDAKSREASIEALKTDSLVRAILISFKAGSTGLNLTACNNVILVDLWWNPALEDQAFDRAHRFGQQRDVNIFKLKIDDSVEDRILMLQEKKRELTRAALSGDKLKNMRLGMEDLLALFRPGAKDDDDDD